MITRLLICITIVLAPLCIHAASPVKARTLSGTGVVALPAGSAMESLPVYREPGLGEMQTLPLTLLPPLRLAGISPDRLYLPVMAKKRGWLKVMLDDSERTGWLEMRRGWEYGSWGTFLENRQVVMLKGIRKDYYLLRKEASVGAEPIGNVEKSAMLVCREIDGDWAFMESGSGVSGWLRWRDENGRLLLMADISP